MIFLIFVNKKRPTSNSLAYKNLTKSFTGWSSEIVIVEVNLIVCLWQPTDKNREAN
jgi:hypothetical protein